jgi:chlorobactene glucosyltransferase
MIVSLAALFVTAVLLGMAGITLSNLLLFPRLRAKRNGEARTANPRGPAFDPEGGSVGDRPQHNRSQLVSVLVPARNEAAVIAATVHRLLEQDYPCFELLVLDDHSTDGTGEIARAAGRGDARLRVLPGADLPPRWAGKNWACHQLSQAARGERLVFTDADTIWAAGALSALMTEMDRTGADLLTGWPTQITVTWPERLVVPLMAMIVIAYLPVLMTHHTSWAAFAAANGQCMAFRRKAYDVVGGHAALKGEVLEDVKFARRIKAKRLRLRMADGNRLISCRMYDSWPAVRDGYAKNILAGYSSSLVVLTLATLFHLLVFVAPPLWLLLGWLDPAPLALSAAELSVTLPGWPWWPLALTATGMALRAASAWFTRQRARDAVFMPISALLMTIISMRSAWWQLHYGGPVWKGRVIKA